MKGSLTGVFDFVIRVAENFKRTAKLLGSKGRVESKKDLNYWGRSINALLLYRTHLR